MAIMFFFISVNLYLCLCIFSILIILSWCLVGAGSPRATMIASTGGIIFLAVGENQPLWAKIDFSLLLRSGMHFLRGNQTCSAKFCLEEKLNFLSIWCSMMSKHWPKLNSRIVQIWSVFVYVSRFLYIRNCICTVYKSVFVLSVFLFAWYMFSGDPTLPPTRDWTHFAGRVLVNKSATALWWKAAVIILLFRIRIYIWLRTIARWQRKFVKVVFVKWKSKEARGKWLNSRLLKSFNVIVNKIKRTK